MTTAALAHPPGLHDPSTPNAPGTAASTSVCSGPYHGTSTDTSTESPPLKQRDDTSSPHQGCFPEITGSLCPPPAPNYATLTVQRTPTATVTTDGIIAGAAAGISSFSTNTAQSPTVSTPQLASTATTQPADTKSEHVFLHEGYDSGQWRDYLILNQDTNNCFQGICYYALRCFFKALFNLGLTYL